MWWTRTKDQLSDKTDKTAVFSVTAAVILKHATLCSRLKLWYDKMLSCCDREDPAKDKAAHRMAGIHILNIFQSLLINLSLWSRLVVWEGVRCRFSPAAAVSERNTEHVFTSSMHSSVWEDVSSVPHTFMFFTFLPHLVPLLFLTSSRPHPLSFAQQCVFTQHS